MKKQRKNLRIKSRLRRFDFMPKLKKTKNYRSYSADYRNLYGKNLFSTSVEDKFYDGNFEEDDERNFRPQIRFRETEETKKSESFRFLKQVLKKSAKILLTAAAVALFVVLAALGLGLVVDTERKEKLIYYDNLIWPVVMQDPDPFDEECPLNKQVMLKAGVWDASFRHKTEKNFLDEEGRQIVFGKDVKDSIKKLFNADFDINESIPNGVFFFNYDSSQDKFYIEPISSEQSFFPRTKNFEPLGENLVKLTVEYIYLQNQFEIGSKFGKEAKAEKTMTYILKEDLNTKNNYIFEVKKV